MSGGNRLAVRLILPLVEVGARKIMSHLHQRDRIYLMLRHAQSDVIR